MDGCSGLVFHVSLGSVLAAILLTQHNPNLIMPIKSQIIDLTFIFCFCLILSIPSPCLSKSHELSAKYWEQAYVLSQQGKYSEAARMFEKCVLTELASSEPRQAVLAVSSEKAGHYYNLVGEYDKAIEFYQQALEIGRKLGKDHAVALQLNNIGMVYSLLGQHDQALDLFHQSLDIFKQLKREKSISSLLNNIGEAHKSLGYYKKALKYFHQALKISNNLGNKEGIATEYNNIAQVYEIMGQYRKSLDYYQQALDIFSKLGKIGERATLLNNIGVVYNELGEFDKAIDFYQQALEINKKLGMLNDVSSRLNNIGVVYNELGKYDKAIECFTQSLEIQKKLGLKGDAALSFSNIAMAYYYMGRFDKAIELHEEALELDKKFRNERAIAADLNSIGLVYVSWGQQDKALDYYRQALEINKRLGLENAVASILNNIGMIYHRNGQHTKAIDFFSRALEVNRKINKENDIAVNLNNIGSVYQAWGEQDKALDYYQQALAVHKKSGAEANVAIDMNNIGTVYATLGQHEKAIEILQQGFEIERTLGMDAEVAATLTNIGVLHSSLGAYDKAIEALSNSINIIENIRKTASGDTRRDYLASQINAYQFLASAYFKNNNPSGVLKSIEQSRAKLLAEQIAGADSRLSVPSLERVQKGLNDDEVILIFSNIDKNNYILMAIADSDISVQEVSKDTYLSEVKDLYRDDLLLMLEQQRGFTITTKSEHPPLLEDENIQHSEFERSINYYRRTLVQSATNDSSSKSFARVLYNLLIKPVKDRLVGKKKLIIMPDGILGFLPFETLVNDQGQYVAENFSVSYTQSLTVSELLNKRRFAENRKPLLAFGGAVYDEISYNTEIAKNSAQLTYLKKRVDSSFEQNHSLRSSYESLDLANWANLPGTLGEVNEIITIISGADVLTGNSVSENKVKALSESGKLADYKVLHFATHGLSVPSIPELSAIVLSQFKNEKNGEDGYLRMGEIAKLKINADFVNLSACETGLGKIYGGEGVVGLTQSFLIAGANGLSVSLWQVADESTAKFMTEFYRLLKETGLSYSKALTKVKRGFIRGDYGKKWQAPCYWSPFVYYGK